jgi:hypothetical protein
LWHFKYLHFVSAMTFFPPWFCQIVTQLVLTKILGMYARPKENTKSILHK